MRYSYSSLSKLQLCERLFAYSYIENYEAIRPKGPAAVRGTAWHALLQAHWLQRGHEIGSLLEVPDHIDALDGLRLPLHVNDDGELVVRFPGAGSGEYPISPAVIIDAVAWDWEQLPFERQEEMAASYGAPLADRLENAWARYQQRWGATLTRMQPLLTETRWTRLAPNGQELMGYVDLVFWDPDVDMVIVQDVKSGDGWPQEADHILDLMDSQTHLMAWGVAPKLRELGSRAPEAVEYDRWRSKKPATPQLTQAGALSKSTTDYDAFTYREWCETKPRPEPTAAALAKGKTAEDFPVYEMDPEHLATLEADKDGWFRRSRRPVSLPTITAHVLAAQAQAKRASRVKTKTAPISPSKACGWCDFSHLCRAEIVGGKPEPLVLADYGLRKKTQFGRQ